MIRNLQKSRCGYFDTFWKILTNSLVNATSFYANFINTIFQNIPNPHLTHVSTKLCFETKSTKLYTKMLLVKRSENNFVFSPVFYLIMWLMKASKSFGKMTILKIWELIFLGGVKTHFGKLMMHLQAWLYFFLLLLCCSSWSN